MMTVWPGGACPDCGDEMPPRVLRCRTCGAPLNPELQPRPIEAPEPVVLREVIPMKIVNPRGAFVGCPNCERELRIASHYDGCQVQCKHCTAPFLFSRKNPAILRFARYVDCPHCSKELRLAEKYMGCRVACKFCDGPLKIEEASQPSPAPPPA